MDYKERIVQLLDIADEKALRLIWKFVRALLKKQ